MTPAVPLPEKIGRYQILQCVGRGGMGVLYQAYDPVLDREVAVKVMLADLSDEAAQMRPRFYREAKAAAKLQHRNIVTVFEFAEEANQPCIVMEFLRGMSLAARMTTPPPLTLGDKLDIVAQLCAGLGYAHSQGVVHRDVKPANVFLLADGSVKLLDFGIARLTSSTLTQQGDMLGSAPYMSPEQVAGGDSVDGRADVWSTGVLLYELLSGRKPFEGGSLTNVIVRILREAPPAIDSLVPDLPRALVTALERALEKDVNRRTPSAEALGRELQMIRQSLQATASTPSMEETHAASTRVLQALHDEHQKQAGVTVGDRTLVSPARPAAPAPSERVSKGAIMAGGVAVVAVAALGVWVFMRGEQPVTQIQSTNSAPTEAAPASPAVTVATPQRSPEPEPEPVAKPNLERPPAASSGPIQAAKPEPTQGARPEVRQEARPEPTSTDPPPRQVVQAMPVPVTQTPAPSTAPVSEPQAVRPGVMVDVSLSAAYPFEVFDGGRSISPAARSHELTGLPSGRTLRLVAPEVFLDHDVRIEPGPERRFEYSPPGLGRLDIRAARGDCRLVVGKRDLGFGPWQPVPAVAGDHQVSLVCPDGQNPIMRVTVTQGLPARALFRQ